MVFNWFFHVIINNFFICFSYQVERTGIDGTRREWHQSFKCKVAVQPMTGGIAMGDISARRQEETS